MKSVIAHAVLALGGLWLAYSVWTEGDAPERAADAVTVWDCDAGDVKEVRLKKKTQETIIARRSGYFWITVKKTPEKGKPDTKRFVGSKAVKDYLKTVAPFVAQRSLGKLKKKQLKEIELDKPQSQLVMRCGGKKRTFEIGGSAFGVGDRYARAKGGGSVYLLNSAILKDIESAEFRLMQRELMDVEKTKLASASVKGFERNKKLEHRNRLDPDKAEWVDAEAPDRRNELYSNWLERVDALRVQKYLDEKAAPGSDIEGESAALTPIMTVEFSNPRGKVLEKIEMVKAEAGQPAYYARSGVTRTWARIVASTAKQVEDDLRVVLGLQPAPAAEPKKDESPAGVSPAQSSGTSAPPGARPPGANPPGANPPGANPPGAKPSGAGAASPGAAPADPHAGHAH